MDCSTHTCDYVVTHQEIVYIDCVRGTTHLDAHEDERLEVVLVEEGENLRRRHREQGLFDRGEVERAE